MRRETGADRVWVDADGVHCDTAGARLDSEWGSGLAEFAGRADLRAAIARAHGADVLAEVDRAVADELAAQVPGSPAEAARRAREQGVGAPIFAEWLAADQRVFFDRSPREAPAELVRAAGDGDEPRRVRGARGGATLDYTWQPAAASLVHERATLRFRDGDRRLRLDVAHGTARWSAAGFAPDDDARIAAMVAMLLPSAVRRPDEA